MEKIEYETIQLERLKVGLQKIISIPDLKIHFFTEHLANEIKVVFSKDYLCQKQEDEICFYTPKTWKDHFKMKYNNHWLIKKWLRKHPIQFKNHIYKVSEYVAFPDVLIPRGDEFKERFVIYKYMEMKD